MQLLDLDKLTLTLNGAADYIANWLESHTSNLDGTVCGDDGTLRLFLWPAKRLPEPLPGATLALTMAGKFLRISSLDSGDIVPVIVFHLTPLAPQQVEMTIAYRHALALHYLVPLLKEMVCRWPVANESVAIGKRPPGAGIQARGDKQPEKRRRGPPRLEDRDGWIDDATEIVERIETKLQRPGDLQKLCELEGLTVRRFRAWKIRLAKIQGSR
jgi:hypothetical protein